MRGWRLLVLAMCAGCDSPPVASEDLAPLEPVRGQGDGGVPDGWDRPLERPDDNQAALERTGCAFHAGDFPAATLGASQPLDNQIPIDHVIIMMNENRSFDHYLSRLPALGVMDVDVATPSHINLDSATQTKVPFHHSDVLCFEDIPHSWEAVHAAWEGGKLGGFVDAAAPDGARAMGFYDENDLPFYYALAMRFAISDRYFSPLLGETLPNRLYAYGASSYGLVKNGALQEVHTSLFDRLNERHISWKVYSANAPPAAIYLNVFRDNLDKFVAIDQFFSDAQLGRLPSVAWVDPVFGGGAKQSSEHPPADFQVGQRFGYEVVTALIGSPNWSSSALFLTYDEAGGLFDHVPPPPACPPDDLLPEGNAAALGHFDRYGFRVPLYVVSPYVRPGYVSHVVNSHTSIVRFVETRFRLPALTARDANADALLDLFDFHAPPLTSPAPFTRPALYALDLAACQRKYPTGGL